MDTGTRCKAGSDEPSSWPSGCERTREGDICFALSSFPKNLGLELGLEGWWEFRGYGWGLRRAFQGQRWLEQRPRKEGTQCAHRMGMVWWEQSLEREARVRLSEHQGQAEGRWDGAGLENWESPSQALLCKVGVAGVGGGRASKEPRATSRATRYSICHSLSDLA